MPDVFVKPTQKKELSEVETKAKAETPQKSSNTPSLFSSYCFNPVGVSFANQETDEEMVLFLRRHFITNFPWIFYTFSFLIAPPLLFATINLSGVTLFSVPQQFSTIMVLFYYVLVLNYIFSRFLAWFYHVGIVTKKRLIDLDVDNILHYHLAETNIEDIVDVSYSQKGFFQSFFNYGDVPIQTEALKANFEFEHTPKPSTVADIITDLRPDLKKNKHHDA